MENKYYTPDISEFHIGFECEIQSSYGYQKGEYPRVLGMDSLTLQDMIDNGETTALRHSTIRVKYLDKEDIENLGWEFEKQHAGLEEISFNIDIILDSSLGEEPELDRLTLDYDLDSKYLRIAWLGEGDVTRFSGYIKNKSELKRLMKQLDIYE